MNNEKLGRIVKKTKWMALAFVATILITAIPVASWLTYERHVGALAKIDSPVSLYINSGAGDILDGDTDDMKTIKLEEQRIIYLDLSDIDVMSKDNDGNRLLSKDFVFCIRGEYLENYYLQLAYTTNNQFSYDIYHTCSEGTAGAKKVTYYGAVSGNEYNYYYLESGKITLTPLNKQSDAILGIKDLGNQYYADTYGSYTNVNKYAVPIYWRSGPDGPGDANGEFSDYYILHVSWGADRVNDRETDILYIAAGK